MIHRLLNTALSLVGTYAGDLIAEYILTTKHGIGLNKILGTIHIYPTLAEANKYVAGEWKRAHVPALAMRILKNSMSGDGNENV